MKLKRGIIVIVGLVMFLSSFSVVVDKSEELSVESDAAFVLKGVSNLT